MIAAPDGQELICADFSSIEARGLAWMAGQENVLKAFVEGLDLYKIAAGDIYGRTYNDITKEQRQVGKVAVLALGYQGAKGAFNAMATGYGVHMKDDQVDKIVKNWRNANSHIVNWWYDLNRAAEKAINNPGKKVKIGRTVFRHTKGHLWLKLPSGRLLCFPLCRLGTVQKPWGREKGILYKGENSFTHKVEWLATYGGKIAENIVQALCRDLLAEALVRVEAKGYEVCMHVHDEIVAMRSDGGGSLEEFETTMSEVPAWAEGMPIGAEGWTGRRYRK
jgi:DNA polymerase